MEPSLANKDPMEPPGQEIFPLNYIFISQPAVTERINLNPEVTAPDINTGDGGLIENPQKPQDYLQIMEPQSKHPHQSEKVVERLSLNHTSQEWHSNQPWASLKKI